VKLNPPYSVNYCKDQVNHGRIYLGEFEELILLTVGVLIDDAYAVAITKEIEKQADRSVNVSAVHKSVYRLRKRACSSRARRPRVEEGRKAQAHFHAYGLW